MQRIAVWLTPVIAVGVAIFLVVFMVQINRSAPMPVVAPAPINQPSKQEITPQKRWLDTLAASERLGYFYPVNEIFIQLDLDMKPVTEQIFRLSANISDPYRLFCLQQELKQHKLKYFLSKEKDGIDLLVYSKEKDRMKALVKRLKNYDITATISPYKEEKRWINTK